MAEMDIAVVGLAFKLPQGVEDVSSLWETLEQRKNLMTEWPESRANLKAFYHEDKVNRLYSRGAHFIDQDPAEFDAPFFSVTAKEATAMDPMQRWTLETSYRAFENAGMPVSSLKGSQTAVFSASMSDDYTRMVAKDPETAPRMTITGSALSILPNRVSWYFDLLGPSVHIDTACSSSMVAVDLACQSIRSGDSTAALVTGANLILGPEGSILLSNLNFVSEDSVCWSFDSRANGYARGEGIGAIVLKPVSDAVRDGDMIRAVIRGAASNQDGHTPGLTQPSTMAQEKLIRHVYQKAGLSFESTRYIEAHGTGTAVGDPIEMKALGRVFRPHRSAGEPLYVGSIKANIGHLEGGSGLAGILKSILILEKGIIPPHALFEKINPAIDANFYHINIPTKSVAWPSQGLRRISVNSFGFGGANSHIILDDAYHYLQDRGMTGNHCTTPSMPPVNGHSTTNGTSAANGNGHHHTNGDDPLTNGNGISNGNGEHLANGNGYHTNGDLINGNGINGTEHTEIVPESTSTEIPSAASQSKKTKLLVFTGADEKSLKRVTQQYQDFYKEHISGDASKLDQLAFTLAERRTRMLWRTYAIADDNHDEESALSPAKAIRTSADAGVAYVFTGQGAQYVNMGMELIQYSVFEKTLRQVDDIYASLGCPWSIFDEISNAENINKPEYSQPLSTALQIALVELLKSFKITPRAVVGHSSGEIAAAYAIGALSLRSACRVSYFRGQLAGKLRATASTPGAMISVNLPEDQVSDYLSKLGSNISESINTACVNSPLNCTLSGPEPVIDELKIQLDKDEIFAQKLKTGVAYHSKSMSAIAQEYLDLIGPLETDYKGPSAAAIPMVSTVTGQSLRPAMLASAQYWVDNMVSPVKFSDAVQLLTRGSSKLKVGMSAISDLIEIGPHCALRRPVQDTLSQAGNRKKQVRYTYILNRNKPVVQATLELIGHLFCHGHDVSIPAANQQIGGTNRFLVDCPQYPFDHSHKYWAESRISRGFRQREAVAGEILGTRFQDWNPLEPRWRNFWSPESTPWVADHVVSDTIIFPGTGMLVMALDAVKEMASKDRPIRSYYIKEAHFLNPIIIKDNAEDRTETALHLRPIQKSYEKESLWSDIKIFSYVDNNWTECFKAQIQIQYEESSTEVDRGLEQKMAHERILDEYTSTLESCKVNIDSTVYYQDSAERGTHYGEWFQLLKGIRWDGHGTAVADVDVTTPKHKTSSLVHPAILDAALQALGPSTTKGLTAASTTYVPQQLLDTWVSASGWQSPSTSTIHYMTTLQDLGTEDTKEGRIIALADDGSVLCTMKKLVMATVGKEDTTSDGGMKRLLYGIEWKPQLSLLEPQDLQRVCDADTYTKNDSIMIEYRNKMDTTLDTVLSMTLKQMTQEDREKVPDFLKRHIVWMEHRVAELEASGQTPNDISDENLETTLQELEALHAPWKLFTEITRGLKPILRGEMDPLQLVFDTSLAEAFYADMFESTCDLRFQTFLDLASHENPNLRILEVGAGTGGMTTHVLSTLQQLEKETGSLRFSEYTYTDISPTFFENARTKWNDLSERMMFKAFDLERDPSDQGFQVGSYDVVIAGSVLHATMDLTVTIQHVHKCLKPGGKLVFLEPIAPQDTITNFGFGLIPGWWRCIEEWRDLCPSITEGQWDQFLRNNGFSGNDLCLRDYKSDRCHLLSVIVTTAQEQMVPDGERKPEVVIVADKDYKEQLEWVEKIESTLLKPRNATAKVLSLDQLQTSNVGEDEVVISLLEMNKPFLSALSENTFESLKTLIRQMKKLLWVTLTDANATDFPHYSLMKGFLRSMRSEAIDKKIISLAIESKEGSQLGAQYITKVFQSAFEEGSTELEYVVQDGALSTGRVFEEISLNETMWSLVSPQLRVKPWLPGPALQLTVTTPGMLDTLQFVEDGSCQRELQPHEIEIESRAWGLNFRDVFVALGRLDDGDLGFDCSGVVTRIGPECDGSVQPGDRVCMVSLGCMRTYPRAHESSVAKIPDDLSFEAAASIIGPGITAYYALLDVARLKKGDKILIHSATGSTGQLAIWVAKMRGAEVFATVGFDQKKQLLIDKFGIQEDHIFYSRNTSFAQGIMRVTKGYGVDVVLNSLSGDGLRASWECVAPYGRFIEIGKADITSNASLPMACFAKNVTFAAVDLHHVMESDAELTSRLLRNTMALANEGSIQYPNPLHVYPVSDLEHAFRFLQSGKNTGRIVISVNPTDEVPQRVLEHRSWTFKEDATYVVAGGLGGIGRAIIRWMANRGAKHLILPSRSGPASKAATEAVAELAKKGVNVVAPKCDVSSASSLAEVLEECSKTMPPVKGCINAAMVLQDAVFDNMTHAQWQLTINSKVHSTWNLHQQLPQDLDFFVLLSSLGGVYGNVAQSNYAAGCSFQDAVARYRTTQGQKAISFDIGWMRNIGIIAETASYQRQRKNAADMQQIDDTELLALLSIYCDPELGLLPVAKSQLFIGLLTPADFLIRGQDPQEITNRPLFAPFSRIVGNAEDSSGQAMADTATLFKQATESDERAEIVIRALGQKLARAMSISPDDVEPGKRLSHYGVDSLMAVELRNWINKDFSANVAVFDIMGGATISAIADLIVEKSTIGK